MKPDTFFYIVIYVFANFVLAQSDENYFEDAMDLEDMVDPHSFHYDKSKRHMINDIDSDTTSVQVDVLDHDTESISDVEDLDPHSFFYDRKKNKMVTESDFPQAIQSSTVAVFYKRLVNLLLSNLDVKIENDEYIAGILNMELSHSQMAILKNLEIDKISLREIDAILSDVIKKPTYTYISRIMYTYDQVFKMIKPTFYIMQEYRNEIIVGLVLLMCFLLMRRFRFGRIPIFVVIQIGFILSFFMTWWHLIQEAEIKLTASQMQFKELPISCQPHKMSTWQKFFYSVVPNDDCEKYYKAMMTNPKLQITPAIVLSHLASSAIVHPITVIGTVISNFIENATGGLPWMYGWIVKLLLFLSVALVIIMMPFCLSGASFCVGLGPLFKFRINDKKNSKQNNSIQDSDKREPVQIILQLPEGSGTTALKISSKADQSKPKALTNTNSESENFEINHDVHEVEEELSSENRVALKKYEACTLKDKKMIDERGDN